ncbi:hypothetical protein BZZ01_03635 [Nostocales cyanobacterium HT-58-2]|nr:hypothetical protein BZZ01_03635 [Nostocales cyanobacterium HT-58-2]
MKTQKTSTTKTIVELPHTEQHASTELSKQPHTLSQPTFGQRLADAMAAKVGSWSFLTVQTGILATWVGMNMMPGVPHWDEQPFILLNLVFSFASAYTAPVVLMSQNRQSEEDRKNSEIDHAINRKAAYGIELLHEKIDQLEKQHRLELAQLLEQQRQYLQELRANVNSTPQEKVESEALDNTTTNEVENTNLIYLKPLLDSHKVVVKVASKAK